MLNNYGPNKMCASIASTPTPKQQNIDVDKKGNYCDFHSSVTLTKWFGCFWDTFDGVRRPPGTQLVGEMPYYDNMWVSTTKLGA